MEPKNFEIEVLTRLTVIETKLDGYKEIKEKTEEAYSKSFEHEKRIEELEDNNKWLWRTTVGATITSFVGVFFIIFKIGLGIV